MVFSSPRPDPGKHIVCFATQAWGHTRPLVHLSARLVKLRPVTVTFLTTNLFFDGVNTELMRAFDNGEAELASRIRIVSIGDISFVRSDESDLYFRTIWKILLDEGDPICARTGRIYPSLPKPKAIVIDLFAIDPINSIKALSGDGVKIFSWSPGLTYIILRLFGPESLGGKGDVRAKAEEEARLTGQSCGEVVMKTAFVPRDEVVRLPGMPPMYDYEYYPQDFELPADVPSKIFPYVHETMKKADGILLATPESYEPDAIAATKRWYGETGRPVYVTGPLVPSPSRPVTGKGRERTSISMPEADTLMFLDEALKLSGKTSLVYISFGSMAWPVRTPDKVWAFLDVLIEFDIPFILSHASPVAVIPDHVRETVKTYGKGLLSPWTPQQLILDHPATGWFVTHGGHNGVTEAISAGVPLILWPLCGDQPLNAVHITDTLQIGYELLEVRSGHGLKRIYRNGYTPQGTLEAVQAEAREVLTKAFGQDGAEKRKRLEALRKTIVREWEDGMSKRDVTAFVDSIE